MRSPVDIDPTMRLHVRDWLRTGRGTILEIPVFDPQIVVAVMDPGPTTPLTFETIRIDRETIAMRLPARPGPHDGRWVLDVAIVHDTGEPIATNARREYR